MAKPKPNLDWLGQTIGDRYVIEEFIDQGGMSTVYKASDPNLKRTVAIKLIHTHLSRDPEFVRRFEQEATAVAQLRHPNIVQVYDFSHEDNLYYMVMEYVPGDTLKGKLNSLHDKNQQSPIAETIRIMALVCDAVAYAHDHDMIHRDLKPANVMITPNGQPILMDFGVAKMLTGTEHTATGTIIGTAKYMSPEQARGDRPDERSDIYALGVMLYEMLAGHPPFEADTTVAILMKHVNEPVPDIRQIQRNVPDELVEIIDKALAKDRNDRYQSAAHMSAALKLINRLGQSAAPVGDAQRTVSSRGRRQSTEPSGVKPPPSTVPSMPTIPEPTAAPAQATLPINRNLMLIGAAALVLIVILGVGAFLLFSGDSSGGEGETPVAVEEAATAVPEQQAQVSEEETPTSTEEAQQVSAEALNLPSAVGMVKIDSGTYTVGRDAPSHEYIPPEQVELNEVWIDQYEVTNADYAAFLADTGNPPPTSWSDGNMPSGKENHPVKGVTWELATAYCEWANKRLPTEAEWEVAARGPEGSLFPWGDDQRAVELPRSGTHIVGTVPGDRSAFGAYDMAGNVWEWVGEAYAPIADGDRILRGGENGFLKDMAYRLEGPADQESLIQSAGFRCAADQVSITEAAILYEDDFTDPASGWPNEDVEGQPYRYGYHPPDYYHVEPRQANTSVVVTHGQDFADVSVESEAFVDHTDTENGEYRYGLVVRQVSENEYYAFTVAPRSGTWAVLKSTSSGLEELATGQVNTLQGFAPAGFVPEKKDTLRVNASGSDFEFYVNGDSVAHVSDGDYASGQVGFYAETFDETLAHVHYESLIVREAEITQARLLYEDDFTDPATGWPNEDVEGKPYRVGYHPPDYYHVEPRQANTRVVATQGDDFTDVSVESEVFVDHTDTETGDYRYGLVVRRVSENEYYAFTVSPRSGTWSVLKSTTNGIEQLATGAVNTLQGFAPAGFVPEQADTLRVNASGSNFEFYVNGDSVGRVSDGDYASGEVGFYAETFDETLAHIHYESIAIRQAEAPVQARLLFEDDFTDPATGWLNEDVEGQPYRVGYHPPDYYHVEPRQANTNVVATQGDNFTDVSAESEVFVDHTDTETGDYRYGLVVRRVSENEYYAFTVSPRSGTWAVLKSTPSGLEELITGEVDTLQGFAPAGFVPEKKDTLRVDAGGSSFMFYINGDAVAQVRDGDYASGEVGFYAETFDETLAHIHYESITVREFEAPPVQVLLDDEFTDPATGWPNEDVEGQPYRIGYHPPDYYHVEPREANTNVVVTHGQNFSDVSVESEAFVDHTDTDTEGYRYGLVVRRVSENEYYAFTVSPRSGTWAALKSTPSGIQELGRGTVESLQGFAPAGFVPEQADDLQVDANGSNFEFYVNGDLLAQVSDGDYASGQVGFYAETFDETLAHIHYESIIVREPEALAISISQ